MPTSTTPGMRVPILIPALDADRGVRVVEDLDPAHGRQRRPQVAVDALELFRAGQVQHQLAAVDSKLSHVRHPP